MIKEDILKKLKCVNIGDYLIDIKDIEYIIYIRKSTDEVGKQVQSLEDQLDECKKYIERNNYNIAKLDKKFESEIERFLGLKELRNLELKNFAKKYFVVIEKESAKKYNNRPKWRKIIEWIEKGKIKGIISYHPDRQSRNLKEAGELIDLLDNNKVDLRYSSVHFDNTTSNKMILGVLFVLAKHYSDKLADDVIRGIKSQLEKGKRNGVYKYGYYTDKDGFFRKDPEYFDVVKDAFKMRLEGKSYKDITKFLISKNLVYRKKNEKGEFILAKKSNSNPNASSILKDSFYFGVYKYVDKAKKINICVDFRKKADINFIPMITEKEYEQIIGLVKLRKKSDDGKIIKQKIFKTGFVITENGREVSSGYINRRKEQYEKFIKENYKGDYENAPSVDDWIDEKKVSFKFPDSDETYKKRRVLGKKISFTLEEIENYLILPALKLLDIDKLHDFYVQVEEQNEFNKLNKVREIEKKELEKEIEKFKEIITEKETELKKQKINIFERKDFEEEIKLHKESIKLLKEDIKQKDILYSNRKIALNDFVNSIKFVIKEYDKFKVKEKSNIIEILFEKLYIDEKGLFLYCKPKFVPFFKKVIKDNLIISTEIPKKINKKK